MRRATRGRYGRFKRADKVKFIDENYDPCKPPESMRCEYPDHKGRKFKFPLSEMYYQKWEMTSKELKEAVKQYDMASLEMTGRFVCDNCKKLIKQ